MNSEAIDRPVAILGWLSRIERVLATVAFISMVVVSFLDVALREMLGHGLDGAREAAIMLMVVMVMAGHGLATAAGRQLRPRFVDGLVPEALQPKIIRIGHLVSVLIHATLAALAAILVGESLLLGEASSVLGVPHWIVQLVMPAAFSSAVIRHAIYALRPDLQPQAAIRELMDRGPTTS